LHVADGKDEFNMKRLLFAALVTLAAIGCGSTLDSQAQRDAAVDVTTARLVKVNLPGMT
jgi:hypothetical protein